jgi:hypothetical protein
MCAVETTVCDAMLQGSTAISPTTVFHYYIL